MDAKITAAMRSLADYLNRQERVCILGLGREGRCMLEVLLDLKRRGWFTAELRLADRQPVEETLAAELPSYSGDQYLRSALGWTRLLIKAPGVSLGSEPRQPGNEQRLRDYPQLEVSCMMDLFFRFFADLIPTLGISGTKGKSTTTSLSYSLLRKAQPQTLLRGNIGVPVFEGWRDWTLETRLCIELSSHQLEFCRRGPRWGALLNFYPEHLDHYASYEAYVGAKLNLLKGQTEGDFFLLNCCQTELYERAKGLLPQGYGLICDVQNAESLSRAADLRGEAALVLVLDTATGLLRLEDAQGRLELEICPGDVNTGLRGPHLLLDVAVALGLSRAAGLDLELVEAGLRDFCPLPHRCQFVAEKKGVAYYNDSISTIPQTCLLALEQLPQTRCLLIGGMDRGLDYSDLAEKLLAREGLELICLPDTGAYFASYFRERGAGGRIHEVPDMRRAVAEAAGLAQAGEVVLLSPAASSYNCYRNFEARGEAFLAAVASLDG